MKLLDDLDKYVVLAMYCLCTVGCFGPSPFQVRLRQLAQEKNTESTECNQQIDDLVQFFGQREDALGREIKAAKACPKNPVAAKNACMMAQAQRIVHVASELTGDPEPDCSTDLAACQSVTTDLVATETCFKQKIGQPYEGVCQTDGLGRECVLALDAGTLCFPKGPELPACNQLIRTENGISGLASAYQESERTAAARSQANALWAQARATQQANLANQSGYMVTTPGQPPTFIQPLP